MDELDKCFYTLKRVKIFLRNIISQDWLSAFAMLSAEKVMTQEINFNDKVTDKPANCKENGLYIQIK
jgi:hypothetical protein